MSFEEPYRVLHTERRTPTIIELWLRPAAGALDYLPGEYVLLEDRDHAVPPRSYSIANAPRPDGLISLLVTSVPDGETSTWVHERLRVGEEVSISGPYVIDRERFAGWQARHPQFRFIRTLTRAAGPPPRGRIPALLPMLYQDLGDPDLFIAGAPGFVLACATAADGLGAQRARVHTEVFFVEPQPWSGAAPHAEDRG